MPYPTSPFDQAFDYGLITSLKAPKTAPEQKNLEDTLKWLCTAPNLTSYRVNTLKTTQKDFLRLIQRQLKQQFDVQCIGDEIVIIRHAKLSQDLQKHPKEVVVDAECAAAVLRGAHVYSPGVLGMLHNINVDEAVSVYADLSKRKCLKGLKVLYTGPKLHIANGIVRQSRREVFQAEPKGLAVEIVEAVSGCPILPKQFRIPTGWAILQNVPSILCVQALSLKTNDCVLDMCAAPGNKTTHIAALMHNQGIIVALDKNSKKVELLGDNCEKFGAKVKVSQANSCYIVADDVPFMSGSIDEGPPFKSNTFDKVLLDAPCSALGKRPQLLNETTDMSIRSFVPLQRKLFNCAVKLLKPYGRLVYSTCTITLAENEGMVAWALERFPELRLVDLEGFGGGPGWPAAGLTQRQLCMLQRYGPGQLYDSVGFFVACFIKN